MANRPPYQPWFEGDFWSLRVRGLGWLTALMYRAMLQGGWDLDPPCRIPNDDVTLRALAGNAPEDVWREHKEALLSMFDLSKDGTHYTNQRQLEEFRKYKVAAKKRSDKASKGGKAKAAKVLSIIRNPAPSMLQAAPSVLVSANQNHNQIHIQNQEEKHISATPVIVDLKTPDQYEEQRKRENEIIEAAFEHYCLATERSRLIYKLTDSRRKVAARRMEECLKLTKGDYDKAAELLRVAIDNLAKSDWHMGRDPATKGKKYCDWIDHLFKSYEKMEKWWNV